MQKIRKGQADGQHEPPAWWRTVELSGRPPGGGEPKQGCGLRKWVSDSRGAEEGGC